MLINSVLRNINRLLLNFFKTDENEPTTDSFDKHYLSLFEIKDFNILIDNKPFSDQPQRKKQEAHEKLSKCQETMIMQQGI